VFSSRLKWSLYCIAWGIALFAATYDNPSHILAAPVFPVGLVALLPNGEQKAIVAAWLVAPAVAVVGWTIYGALTLAIRSSRRAYTFLLLYAFFCALLVFNVVGCHRTWEAAGGIH